MLKQLWWQHEAFLLSSRPPSRTSISVVGLSCMLLCKEVLALLGDGMYGCAARNATGIVPPWCGMQTLASFSCLSVAEHHLTPEHPKQSLHVWYRCLLYLAKLDQPDLSSKTRMPLDQQQILPACAGIVLCCCAVLARMTPGLCTEMGVAAEL